MEETPLWRFSTLCLMDVNKWIWVDFDQVTFFSESPLNFFSNVLVVKTNSVSKATKY